MKTRTKDRHGRKAAEVPFDPVLFAAAVPSRKPTAQDLEDTRGHENDPIEPKEYQDTDEMLDDP
jgi:hypothetical protein